MQTKTSQVRALLRDCLAWYDAAGEDIRQLSERTEELWFQMDDLVCALQQAENREDDRTAAYLVHALLRCALTIEAEVYYLRAHHK